MKLLVELIIATVILICALPFKALGIAFSPGSIGDLSHQGGGVGTILVPKEIKTNRVEAIPEGTKMSDDGN